MNEYENVPEHVDFVAKRLFENMGELSNGSVIRVEKGGGGPTSDHFHEHDHLFIIMKGEAKVIIEGRAFIVKENESIRVPGNKSHSIWNNLDDTMVMVGLSVI